MVYIFLLFFGELVCSDTNYRFPLLYQHTVIYLQGNGFVGQKCPM